MTPATVRAVLLLLLAAQATAGSSCVCATAESHLATAAEIRYVPDAGGDCWQSPDQTARRGAGDCEDQALYLQHLLAGDGVPSRVVFGIRDLHEPRTGHAWVECEMYGRTYVLDATCRLLAARRDLPAHRYYALRGRFLGGTELLSKFRAYLERTGRRGINGEYEAAAASRPAGTPGPLTGEKR